MKVLTTYNNKAPAELLGPCNRKCANKYWESLGGPKGCGPICAVPGCDEEEII